MKRRSFLSLLAAATTAPALPGGALAKSAGSYSRVAYGYAVFWARHGGAFGTQQLARALQIPQDQAKAMIDDMLRDRLVRVSSAGMRAVTSHGSATDLARTRPNAAKHPLLWRFRAVGRRARALGWQLQRSEISHASAAASA